MHTVNTQYLSPLREPEKTSGEPTQTWGELTNSTQREANVLFNTTWSEKSVNSVYISVTLDSVQVAENFDLVVASIQTTDY